MKIAATSPRRLRIGITEQVRLNAVRSRPTDDRADLVEREIGLFAKPNDHQVPIDRHWIVAHADRLRSASRSQRRWPAPTTCARGPWAGSDNRLARTASSRQSSVPRLAGVASGTRLRVRRRHVLSGRASFANPDPRITLGTAVSAIVAVTVNSTESRREVGTAFETALNGFRVESDHRTTPVSLRISPDGVGVQRDSR